MLRSTLTVSSLDAAPQSALAFVSNHGPIRGDEVVTEQFTRALRPESRVGQTGLAIEERLADEVVGVAVALDQGWDRAAGVHRWVTETVGPPADFDVHLQLAERVVDQLSLLPGPSSLRWRPPSSTGHARSPPPAWQLERSIVEMRAPLPLSGESVRDSQWILSPLDADAMDADDMIGALVRINNAAFVGHPEQGNQTVEGFRARLASAWCAGRGVLVARSNDADRKQIGGFAWMKCVPFRPAELYVVAVDPAFSGHGLGRRLVHAGFRHTSEHHDTTTAMLFVELGNKRARALYRSMGFRHFRHQSVYIRSTPGASDVSG